MAADPQVVAYLQAAQAQQQFLQSPYAQALAQQQAQSGAQAQQEYLQSPLAAQQAYLASPLAQQQAAAARQVPDLTPSETQNFNQQQTDLSQGYEQQSAQNTYARANLQANQQRATTQLGQQYDQQRSTLPGAYAHRGLLNSGIYSTGLDNYAKARTNAFDNSNQSYAQALGQNDLSQQQATQSYGSATGSLAAQKTARRADLASQLRAVQ